MVLRPKLVPSKLDEQQVRQVLHTIQYPSFEDVQDSLTASLPAATLATLSKLQIHFLITFPFEALSLNYEPSGTMSSELSDIYSRFIKQRWGGGYCLQVNVLYRELLAFLDFRFLGVLGRVCNLMTLGWTGFSHTTTLVYLPSHLDEDGGKYVYYMSDVGYGSSPQRPILLRDGWEEYGCGRDKFRLVKRTLQPRTSMEEVSDLTDSEVAQVGNNQGIWILQNQKNGKPEWEDCYQFTPFQCFDADYHAANKSTSHHQSVPFATMIIVVRYLLDSSLLPRSRELVERDGLHSDLYPYHPTAVEQRMIVGDKYIVKKGEGETTATEIKEERQRVELLKSEFGLLKHVETDKALYEIEGKPSALKTKSEMVASK